ncbi:TIGR02594 family protein [Agarivorans albus]|uniref:LysM domain-containing protein n=1 Tax=Agarivorans albus MKT 106 TaxID=1331007 RepID=R9PQN0_AGAAL|nr:TIGR02594 family protein [Agarivorans albus]GAD00396.1 conserved hypothetical protein [Agarivorans albus MKT 106]
MKVKPYVIRRGDTFRALARHYGITLSQMLDENPDIDNPNLIYVGQIILVPRKDELDTVHAELAAANIGQEYPDWFQVALREEGVTEVGGAGNNPRILEYHASTTLDRASAKLDSTPWCSSFANWCMEQTGRLGTDSAWAKSWLNWGQEIDDPELGCIVVFSRVSQNVSGGHVGFFLNDLGSSVLVLGGNQGQKVSRSSYPKSGVKGSMHYKLLGYRMPL